jgi:uncharacterized membrane protein HdeD (DUF308 family)
MGAVVSGSGVDWRWIVALGLAVLVLSCVAAYSIGAADSVPMSLLGALMMLAAAAQIVQAFEIRSGMGFGSCLVSGTLYAAAGVLAIENPMLTANTLTLMLALALVASGLARTWWTLFHPPDPGWGWLAASGAITALIGIVFAIGWPRETVWIVGTLLAIDLAWQGLMTVAFGLVARQFKSRAADK